MSYWLIVFFFFLKADHKKFNQQYRSQYDVYSKAMSLVKKHSKKSSSKVNRSSASYDKEIKVNPITANASLMKIVWYRKKPIVATIPICLSLKGTSRSRVQNIFRRFLRLASDFSHLLDDGCTEHENPTMFTFFFSLLFGNYFHFHVI